VARDLADRVIVITGASSGIGAATAVACAAAGMDVVVNARRAERLEDVAKRIRAAGRRAEVVPGDVTDPSVTEALLDRAEHALGGLHAVFSNAGYGFQAPVVEQREEDLRRIFDVNFFASVALVRAAARRLRDAGRPGHLLLCSSSLAKLTLPAYSAYSATKAAQNHVARAMRMELRPCGIDVSSVHPITTETQFFESAAARSDGAAAAALASAVRDTPRAFVQTPERVAAAVVRCLRRPRPEVWTSVSVRILAAASVLAPRTVDAVLERMTRGRT
jgi:short-subunit dehydrogenase